MSKILLVSATEFEIQPIRKKLKENQVLITGIGVYATVFQLMKKLANHHFDLIIHAGVGGSFDLTASLGSVFQISAERFADIGYENSDRTFNDFFGTELLKLDDPPFENGWMINPFQLKHPDLPMAKGITVNTVSGCSETIQQRATYQAQIESMEGAGLFFVCKQLNLKFISLRAISNYVTPRNRENWELKKAIANLNRALDLFLE